MKPPTCDHGMPSPFSCIDCINDVGLGPAPEPAPVVDAYAEAHYVSRCGCGCGAAVAIGDPIVHLTDGRWVLAGHDLAVAG